MGGPEAIHQPTAILRLQRRFYFAGSKREQNG